MKKKGDVKGLIKALKHKDNVTRYYAKEALIEVLNDKDAGARKKAAEAVGKMGDARVAEILIQTLNTPLDYQGAIEGLREMGKTAVEPLTQALKSIDRFTQQRAAEALGKIEEPPVISLIQALKDQDSQFRCGAAIALGEIGDERAVEPLIQALEDEGIYVRSRAAEALGEIGDERAVKPLIAIIAAQPTLAAILTKTRLIPRIAAARALGRIGDPRAVKPLISVLNESIAVHRSRNEHWETREETDFREAIAEALGRIGDSRAVEPLIDAFNFEKIFGGSDTRAAVDALGNIGDLCAVETLIATLQDERFVRWGGVGIGEQIGLATARALKRITGQDFGMNADRWQQWWEKQEQNGRKKRL